MPIIDTYTVFGAWPAGGADLSLERLKAALSGRDVQFAIAHSTSSVFETSETSLKELQGQTAGVPGLVAAAVVDPTQLVKPWEFAERVAGQNFACVRFFPEVHKWPVANYYPFERCLDALAPSGIPVSVSVTQPGQVTALSRLTQTEEMSVILTHAAIECMPEISAVVPGMKRWYVSTDGLTHLGLLEELVDVIGGERILFGSTAPRGSIEGSIRYVKFSSLPDIVKENILFNNAQQLFGGRLGTH